MKRWIYLLSDQITAASEVRCLTLLFAARQVMAGYKTLFPPTQPAFQTKGISRP